MVVKRFFSVFISGAEALLIQQFPAQGSRPDWLVSAHSGNTAQGVLLFLFLVRPVRLLLSLRA
jgi:hypothetical protein